MRSVFVLATLLASCLVGLSQGLQICATASQCYGTKCVNGVGCTIKLEVSAVVTGTQTITLVAQDQFRFKPNIAQHADNLLTVTDTASNARAGTNTAGTSSDGKTLTITHVTGQTDFAVGALTITVAAGLLESTSPTPAGIYSFKINCGNVDTESDAIDVPMYASSTAKTAVGIATRATSDVKALAPGVMTLKFATTDAYAAAATVTFTASEAIFAASQAAAQANVPTLTDGTDQRDVATTTLSTDSTGKIATLTLGTGKAFNAGRVVTIAFASTTANPVMAANPSTAGMVTMQVKSSVDTTGSTNQYPVFDAASTALILSSNPGTPTQGAAPGSVTFTFVPQTAVSAAANSVTITSSAVLFTTGATTTIATASCTIGPVGMPSVTADSTCSVDTTGKILTVTTVNSQLEADVPVALVIGAELATNAATVGASTTFTIKTSADTTISTGSNLGYCLFNAALTPYFESASVSTLTGLAAPGNMTLRFWPQGTVVGGATAGTVIFTANAAVFDASGSYPGSACQGSDCIVCTSSKDGMPTTVPCTASSDSTGKVLTVTATTASTTTDFNDFTTDARAQIVLTNHMVNPNATAVTFTVSTGVDTTATAAGTGYTTTSVAAAAGAAPSPPGATNTGTYSTATTTVSFTGYTYVAGAAATNFANVVGCAYAKTVSDNTASLTSHMCVASSGPTFSYMTGASTTNTASAARRTGTSVAVALKMYHSLISQTAATAAVTAVGTTLTAINANLAAINLAAGTAFSTAELTATGMTAATWTHSSAAVVVPSMMAMFLALVLVLMQ